MFRIKMVELTAPVGTWASLRAAIDNGADSVYLGVGDLNMRSSSALNFSIKDLPNLVNICHENGVKIYVTLNTVVFDDELEKIDYILDELIKNGVDAVIASDLSVILKAAKRGLPIHISTQANITNIEAIKFYSKWADTVVLSRELTLERIKILSEKIKVLNIRGPNGHLIRLEAFVHGALCMAISGKCYLSLDLEGKSANRGECHQICRRKYKLYNAQTNQELLIDREHIMSTKDLCTLPFIDKLIDCGVSVFKIEGRGRQPEYVALTTRIYKEAIQSVYDDSFSQQKIEKWMEQLNRVYNRGFWEGYYLGKSLGEWTDQEGSSATEVKEYVGFVSNYFNNIGVAEINLDAGILNLNDNIYIIGPTTGVVECVISEMRNNDNNSIQVSDKGIITLKVPKKVRKNDKVYLIKKR
ncbi:MAG: U32 family peptidase [Bacteroidales bacterium]|jgi:putative protease|nr:U32 family peptidase [Bacteroidales bacterium]MDI9575270.1 U32 family peptidase [Bacteroidota bacterium]MDD2592940.1 U32 family peptidase [Bacteroidales bacterium]MDD3755924.1 U32 family peptidase [Bacteroidales bacterium]MDY0400147.1 U32 family peptidase [Bacteroidales bacterium]